MGIAGHMGLFFDPADRDPIINGLVVQPGDVSPWVKGTTDFSLIREDWWEMYRTLEQLAQSSPQRAPLGRLLVGERSIGQGPGTDMFLFAAPEIQAMASAAGSVTPEDLRAAVEAALSHPDFSEWLGRYPEGREAMMRHLPNLFAKIQCELQRVAAGGFEMISFMY